MNVLRPVLAGVVTALVGFGGAFPVVLAGLRAVGADERQAASGLLAVCLASWRRVRRPEPAADSR